MAEQADGSIIIDTEINSDGFKAGSVELLAAIKSLSAEIKKLGQTLTEIFDKPLTPEINTSGAEEKVAALKAKVQELETSLNELQKSGSTGTPETATPQVNIGSVTEKASGLQREIDAVNSSVDKLGPTFQKAMSGSESAMTSFESKADALENKIAELQCRLDAVGQTKFPTQQYAEVTAEVERAKQKFDALLDRQEKMQALGVSESSSQWKSLQYDMELVSNKYHELIALKQQLESSGNAFQMGVDTTQYAQMEATLTAASNRLNEMRADTQQSSRLMSRLANAARSVASNIASAARAAVGKLATGIKAAASGMAKMLFHSKAMNSQLGGLISGAKKFALSLLGVGGVYALLRKAIGAYVAENQQLSNTLSACWTGIDNLLGPIITKLINLVAQAVAYVTTFLKLFGIFSKSMTRAISNAGSAASSAAKKLKRQLASFDELNILRDSSSDGGGGGGVGDVGAELPDVSLPDWAKLMVEQIKAGDWTAAATTLATQLNNMITGVDWTEIGAKIGRFFNGALAFLATCILEFDWYALGVSLGALINNVIANVDWTNLGVVLGGKFIALIEGLGGLFATLDWTESGKALSDTLMGLWDAIDWSMVASTISDGIKGVLTLIAEFLKNSDWDQIGEDVGTVFLEIDWTGIADCAFEAFNAAITAIKGLLNGLPGDIIAIGGAFAAWKISSKLMTDLETILSLPKSITIGISLAIAGITLEAGGIKDAIRNELDGLNFAEIVSGALLGTGGAALIGSSIATWIDTAFTNSAIDLAITEAGINLGVGTAGAAGAALSAGFAGIILGVPAMFTGIYDACVNEINWLNGALTAAGGAAAGAGVGAICAAAGTAITPGIGTLVGLAVGLVADGIILIVQNWDTIVDFLSNFFTVTVPGIWNSFVTWITKTVPAWFKSLPGKIATWFDKLWQPIRDYDWSGLGYSIGKWFGNAIKDAIYFVVKTVPNWLSDLWNNITSALSTFFTVTLPKFFTQWIPQAWESVKTLFSELPQKIWEAIQNGWNWLVDVGKSIIDGIWEGLQTVWTAITNFVSGFVQGVKDALGIHSPSTVFAEIGNYLIDGLLQGISDTWEKLTSFFSNALSSLSTTISNGWNSIKTTTSSAWGSIKSSLSSTWDNLKTAASATWVNLNATVSSGWDKIKTDTADAWNSIKTSLSTTWGNVKAAASTTWGNLKTTISNGWNSAKTNTSTVWNDVKATLFGTWNNIKSSASTAWSCLKTTVSNGWNNVKSDTTSAWNSIKSSLSSTWDNIKGNASSMFSSIKSTIENKGWSGIGSNICSGIANGISSGWDWLKNTVSSLASSLLDAAKSALGIHSPSRVFRDAVGLNIGYGIGEGVEASRPSILKSVSGVADAIANEFNAGDYKTGNIIPTAEVDGALTLFSDKISSSFTSLLNKLRAIADNVTFSVPAVAMGGVIPYKAAAVAASGSGADIGTTIETSNGVLAGVVTQVVANATAAIVTAIQTYSGTTVNLDKTTIAESTIREINRRTRATGKSPLLG